MGPVAHRVSGVTGWAWAFIRAGLSRWVIELLNTGEKAGPFENENWAANVWDFIYYMESVAHWVSGVTGWVWAFIRAVLPPMA